MKSLANFLAELRVVAEKFESGTPAHKAIRFVIASSVERHTQKCVKAAVSSEPLSHEHMVLPGNVSVPRYAGNRSQGDPRERESGCDEWRHCAGLLDATVSTHGEWNYIFLRTRNLREC